MLILKKKTDKLLYQWKTRKLSFLLPYLRWQCRCEEACKTFTNFHLTESSLSLSSLMLRRYITNSGHSSISGRNTHLGSFEMSVYITLIWLYCSISCPGSSQLCPITCHLHLCLCLTLDCKWVFLEQALWLLWSIWLNFAAGEMRLVYSRWLISATMWNCCQVGCRSKDHLWTACFMGSRAGRFPEGIYGLTTLHFWSMCVSCGLVKALTKGLFFSLKMCMKSFSALQLIFRPFIEKT